MEGTSDRYRSRRLHVEVRLFRRVRESGGSVTSRPKSPLGDDAPVGARFVGVGGERLSGFEVLVAFDREAQRAAETDDTQNGHL
jgi:hypothetical protein